MKKICENCKFFKSNNMFHIMDCLNDDISQEEYERCLGDGGEDCLCFDDNSEATS